MIFGRWLVAKVTDKVVEPNSVGIVSIRRSFEELIKGGTDVHHDVSRKLSEKFRGPDFCDGPHGEAENTRLSVHPRSQSRSYNLLLFIPFIDKKLIDLEGLDDVELRVTSDLRSNKVKRDLFFKEELSKNGPIAITEEISISLIGCKSIRRDIIIQDFDVVTGARNSDVGERSVGCLMKGLFKVGLERP